MEKNPKSGVEIEFSKSKFQGVPQLRGHTIDSGNSEFQTLPVIGASHYYVPHYYVPPFSKDFFNNSVFLIAACFNTSYSAPLLKFYYIKFHDIKC